MKILPVEAELSYADGRTHDEAKSRLWLFLRSALKKYNSY